MSLGKMPGIKGLVSGSQGKRRFKSELSVDMISPPLGDFRHTMHVGRGGDVFGDTSFLSNYGATKEPGSPDSASSSRTTGFFTRTFRHVGKTSAGRPRGGSRDLSSPPPDVSPIIKNAISLPQLNIDSPNGCLERVLFPSPISSTDDSFYTYGLQSGFVTLPRLSRIDRQIQEGEARRQAESGGYSLTRSDSLTSFTVDLGPSLMTEVLSFFDNPGCLQMSIHSQAAVEEEEEEEEREDSSSLTETPVQSPAGTSPNPSVSSESFRRNMNSRRRSNGSERTEREEEGERSSLRCPDASAGSPQEKDPGIEAEQFQRAADVLSRHYGGGTVTKVRRKSNNSASPASSHSLKTPPAFSEEEEEIKV
ncbi:Cdc42 effector protein 1 Binder of Rho GTPases 5 [Xyrichtys novacula]|uniref:Cdc42 effector protein 1 Binder of Rho GTPases 5 n=1 Tax=Xyrichtys novacula TaxID=13765 RepID=A0AAV1GRY4_XYRNO|nr:Cdc42 effector protein 1 Binder of Rho GTPases 5 [Xyrichtys novacula]